MPSEGKSYLARQVTTAQIKRLKQAAKHLKKANSSLTHSEALNTIAREKGFPNWKAVIKYSNQLSTDTGSK